MSDALKLVVFDVDGTLVDSQHHVHTSMERAFSAVGLGRPTPAETRNTIGLSLTNAMQQIRPDLTPEIHQELARECEAAFLSQEQGNADFVSAPLFDGMDALLRGLSADDRLILGVATGKSRVGLERMLAEYGFENIFLTKQVADGHPSKPNPSMLYSAMSEVGAEAQNTVIIGDTTFDIRMGKNAQVKTIGVSWGYHEVSMLMAAGADYIAKDAADLRTLIHDIWS